MNITDVLNDVDNKIINYVFSNSMEKLNGCICKFKKHMEFEFRIATTLTGHCDNVYWTMYDKYLNKYTGLLDDVIISYLNPKFKIKNTIFREYKYGKLIQRKHCISKFSTDTSNIALFPMICKLSEETNLESINTLVNHVKNYARTFRQSFHIKTDNKYLLNWSVDKTIRFICSDINDYEIRCKNLIKDINDIDEYDILDLEFEYTGNENEFKASVIALIEFLYLNNSTKEKMYKNISKTYLIYNHYCDNHLNNYIIKPSYLNTFSNSRIYKEYEVPDNVNLTTFIYLDNENYIELSEKNINMDNYKTDMFIDFSVFYGYKYNDKIICLDVYVYKMINISNEPFNEREKYINEIKGVYTNDSIIDSIYDIMTIYIFDEYSNVIIFPNKYYINLRLKLSENKHDYYLYCFNNIPVKLPFIHSHRYEPNDSNEFSRLIKSNINKYDNVKIRFEINYDNSHSTSLIPISVCNDELNTITETLNIMFASYISNYSLNENSMSLSPLLNYTDIDKLTQYIIEKYCIDRYNNVYIYGCHKSILSCDYLLKNVLNYCKINNIILKLNHDSLLMNLYKYYNNYYIEPLLNSNIISNNTNIYGLDINQDVISINKYYTHDMDCIFIPIFINDKLFDFVNIIDEVITNIKTSGIVYLNVHNIPIKVRDYIFDEVIESGELNNEKLKDIIKIMKTKLTAIITTQKLKSSKLKFHNGFYYNTNFNHSIIYNYLFNIIINENNINDVIENITLYCIEKINKMNMFKYEVLYNDISTEFITVKMIF